MKAVFEKRSKHFRQQCLRYLRYVLNDHFVLFLTIFSGFLMIQYSQLLKNLPETRWPLHLALIVAGLALAFWGNFNAFLEKPDQHFLLPKETDVIKHIRQVQVKSFLLWGVIQTGILALLLPLALGLGWQPWAIGLYLLVGLGLKWMVFQQRARHFLTSQGLVWSSAITHDSKQKQAVLKFFSLFTTVKGISQTVKRRRFLDACLSPFKADVWLYLYARAFLRSGDYLALALRLALLSLLGLAFIGQDMVATALALLFNYLLLFQLLALYHHFDYQLMTRLYPVDLSRKKQSLRTFLRRLMYALLALQVLLGLLFFKDKTYLAILIGGQIVLAQFYLAYKVEKLID